MAAIPAAAGQCENDPNDTPAGLADRRTFLLELTTPGREAAGRVTGVVDLLEEHVRARVLAEHLDGFHAVMAVLEEFLP